MAGARWWLSATECSQILEGQIHRKITRSPIEMQADPPGRILRGALQLYLDRACGFFSDDMRNLIERAIDFTVPTTYTSLDFDWGASEFPMYLPF